MPPTTRQRFAPEIAKIIADLKANGRNVKEMKKELAKLNPGPYGHHRKIWANEYMRQLGLSVKKRLPDQGSDNQQSLF